MAIQRCVSNMVGRPADVWPRVVRGSPAEGARVVDENGFISTLGKNKPSQPAPDTYYITKKYFVHKSCGDLRKIVAVLSGRYTCTCTLLFFFLGIL